MDDDALTDFQREVAGLFFSLAESEGYLLAGGAALVASKLTARPTQDLDLFTHAPATTVDTGRDALLRAITARGWTATTARDTPTFCRLVIHGPEDLLIDLALDAPPISAPTSTDLGPTLAPLELAANKLLALFGRAELATSPTSMSSHNASANRRCSPTPHRSTPDSTSACLPRCSRH